MNSLEYTGKVLGSGVCSYYWILLITETLMQQIGLIDYQNNKLLFQCNQLTIQLEFGSQVIIYLPRLVDQQCESIKVEQQKYRSAMSQQMKANVLIYTETNRTFIEEKVYDEFRYECLKDEELKDLDIDKMVKVLKKVYDFGENNPYMQTFFKRAPESINKFITSQYKATSETEDLVIDIGKLVDVIFACIEDGFDSTIPEELPFENNTNLNTPPKKYTMHPPQQPKEDAPQKVRKFIVPKPKTPEKKNFIEKYEMPEKKMPARYLIHLAKPMKEKQLPVQQVALPLDSDFIEKNKAILEGRLQDIYHHYCSQQQNLGQHATFDRIKQQCSQMTVGKFLLFCKVSKVFQDKEMSKQTLVSKFKKVAEGKKQIDFLKFKELLLILDQDYIKIKKGDTGADKQIPTFQARLMLQGREYQKLKRDVDLPFCTREKQGRELKKYATVETGRYTKKEELTSHSGKFGKDLKFEIERKLIGQSQGNKQKLIDKKNTEKIIRLNNIKGKNLPNMEWLIQEDESERSFMKEYRGRDVVGELKKRVNDLSKMQKNGQLA